MALPNPSHAASSLRPASDPRVTGHAFACTRRLYMSQLRTDSLCSDEHAGAKMGQNGPGMHLMRPPDRTTMHPLY